MASVVLVLFIFFIVFLFLVGVVIAGYFIYKALDGDADPSLSIRFKPGDTIAIRPSWFGETTVTGVSTVKNTTKYIVAGGFLCTKSGAISTSPTNDNCGDVNWVYNLDNSLSPSNRPGYFISGAGFGPICTRESLDISEGTSTALKWIYDRKRWTWCVQGGENDGMCMQIATGSFGLVHQGITLTKLPTNFDSLKTNDPEKARFQFTVTKPLTPSSSPSCLAS